MQTLTNIVISSNAPLVQVEPVLDRMAAQLGRGHVAGALNELFEDLQARREEEPAQWKPYCRECLRHPVTAMLHQDPFTHRAFSKPRGYAGDAVMMDYIYGLGEAGRAAQDATTLGRQIFQYMDTRPSAKAVRFRRQLLAALVDEVAAAGGTRVLAVAAGHLREVECSSAVRTGRIRDYLAFDQDEASLAVVERDYAHLGVRTMPGSVRHLLCGKAKPGRFDFVYAAGLYDYLTAPVAAALTARLFEMTAPGGLLLIPNFLTGVSDTGYMEAFMDWHLIYRDHADMRALAEALPAESVGDYRIFDDPAGAITFLLVSKAE